MDLRLVTTFVGEGDEYCGGDYLAADTRGIGKFVGEGQNESHITEWYGTWAVVLAMSRNRSTVVMTPVTTATVDMGTIRTIDTLPRAVSDYMIGLNADGTVGSGCACASTAAGTFAQLSPRVSLCTPM